MEIYLDNSATTKPLESAINACVNAMTTHYGNPSSLHKKGFEGEKILTKAKETISKAISCLPEEIIFTSGATESNNLAIQGIANAKKRIGNKIIISAIEHPSVKEAAHFLEKQGFEVIEIIPDEDGNFNAASFANAVDEKTILVSCIYVSNETGLIMPVEEIARAVKAKNKNVAVHVDAVQAFMKLPIKLKNSNIDLMSFSGHKIHAPKGVGGLFIRKGVRLVPIIYGGEQQNGIRSGTECVPLIASLEASISSQMDNIKEHMKHYKELKEYFCKKISTIDDISLNSDDNCADHIINLSINGIRSEVMLHFLEQFDVFVSSGSACSRGKPSYILKNLGFDNKRMDTAIRISFCPDTTIEMLDIFIEKVALGINTLAKIK